jgi:glutamyl-tRNA(Gln) amidotransferase subunit E
MAFLFSFSIMEDLNYNKLGFRCGLEIHQQLDTHKLFCDCPSIVHDKGAKLVAERRLKAVVIEI